MNELGLTEEVAEKVVARCAEEAKIVVVEQAAKKEADSKAKASKQAESDKFMAALRGGNDTPVPAAEESMPGPMEDAPGGAPETVVHSEQAIASQDELSVEEQAISGMEPASDSDRKEIVDEDDNTAALAEGRTEPPIGDA